MSVSPIQKWRIIHNLGIVQYTNNPNLKWKKVINRYKKVVTPTEHERPVVTITDPNHILADPTFYIQ